MQFEESEFIENDGNSSHGLDYDNKDFYHDRKNLPFPPSINKLKRKVNSNENKN